ncbi:hypothetical protein DPEC_G00280850 [Dallia pectoralis]|uniref:Uncharacterized protein n=1 Tax=Dallia pectoralis TaxID=75939 RepID=A0ACC2FMQ5_DALPE|nr:hypothetical protein DPEC_G00280850 [Dallia pectoralis]
MRELKAWPSVKTVNLTQDRGDREGQQPKPLTTSAGVDEEIADRGIRPQVILPEPYHKTPLMSFLSKLRSPMLTFFQTVLSLVLGAMALLSSYWCEGSQKVPKPLCTATKLTKCIPVPGLSHNSTSIQFSWETGDDRFVFPAFHAGMWSSCEENIQIDAWEEKCRSFFSLTPGSEKGMLLLSVSMELMYVGLLCISCVLQFLQLCLDAFWPSQVWGQILNAYSAVFTILGGSLGMVAHMMFMQVFQTVASKRPEDFKPHSYGYSWAFYVAWLAFTFCMASGVSTLNNYTKTIVMERRRKARIHSLPSPSFSLPLSSHSGAPQYGPEDGSGEVAGDEGVLSDEEYSPL